MASGFPLLIAAGGPATLRLGHALATLRGAEARVELLAVPPAAARPALSADILARAALVLEEAEGRRALGLSADERAALPPACLRLTLPRLAFTAPWPLAGATAAEREATPFGDRLAAHIAASGAEPAQRRAAYDSVQLEMLADLDLALEEEADLLASRDQGCDVQVAGLVLSQFRRHRLFHSPIHPAGPLLHAVAAQILAHRAVRDLLGVTLASALPQLETALDDAFADCQAPVHPAAAADLGLAWWHRDLAYAWQGDRLDFDAWTDRRLGTNEPPARAGSIAAQPDAVELHPAAEVARAVPFFATPIDPAIARNGAALLHPASGRYRTRPVVLATLAEASVLGPGGAVRYDGIVLADAMAPDRDEPAARRRLDAPAMLGTGPGWRDDVPGIATILPRLVAYARARRHTPALRLVLPRDAGTPWLHQALALLGIDDAVEWLGEEVLDCASLAAIAGLDAEAAAPCTREAALALAGMVPMGAPGPRRLFLHHPGHAPRNAEQVAAMLHANGFAIADASRLTLTQRIELLRDAEALVAAQGPALPELAFLPAGAAVLELCGPANPGTHAWSLASVGGLRYGYLVGDAAGAPVWNGPYDVPMAMLQAATAMMTG